MIARMTHLRLIGLRSEQNKILDVLASRGLFEPRLSECENCNRGAGASSDAYREIKLKQSKISFAVDFIAKSHENMAQILKENKKAYGKGCVDYLYDYTLSKTKFGNGRMLITHADFSDVSAKELDLLDVCDALEKLSFEIVDCKARTARLIKTADEYAPYMNFPLKFSQLKTTGVRISLYYGKAQSADELLNGLPCAYQSFESDGNLYAVTCRDSNYSEIDKALSGAGYMRCTLDDDCTALDKLKAIDAEVGDIQRHIYELTRRALAYEKYYDELRILYDVFELDAERIEADGKLQKTASTFVLEGWIPEEYAKSVEADVKQQCPHSFVQLLAAEEADAPPTLVVSKKIIAPYEDVTNMYSAPKYREIDPNPIMSIFFFLFFGLMVGDAAYGVILAVVGLSVGFCKKFDSGMRRLMQLIGWGGVSAIFWGILFGSYFGIDFGDAQVAIWFNPMEEPMAMLYLSIALGVLQITVGYIIQFVKLCKAGKPFSAICDAGSIILLFVALAVFAVTVIPGNMPKFDYVLTEGAKRGLTIAAIALAGAGLALMIIFGGRNNKNWFGKIFGGFKGLYGLINLLSDVLSYCRLFGLALSSCAIALAFNTLGLTLGPAGYVLLVVLHIFNILLAVLSAYVHNVRLQVLEFYGKFYDGEGRLFSPLGVKTKNVRFE